MNRCLQQSVHGTIMFNSDEDDNVNWKEDVEVSLFWKKTALETVESPQLWVFYAAQLMWYREATAPQGFPENDCTLVLGFFFLCKGAVGNDHLSIWSMRTSHAAPWHAAGGERWEQLFNLRSREAAIDGKAPFPMEAIRPWLQEQSGQSRTGCQGDTCLGQPAATG